MKELYNALPLPDDRPVTALCVVEDPSKCPFGYNIVAKTHDQDLDADLWKDGFFGKRVTRYLCLSKTEGPSGFVIDSLCITNEKDSPPNGYVLLSKTYGTGNLLHFLFSFCNSFQQNPFISFTEQRAWRKRQMCYRLSEKSSVFLAITDIIILSKSKKAPEGFTMAGEINGLLVCYKSAPLPTNPNPLTNVLPTHLSVNLKPVSSAVQESNSSSSNSPNPYPKHSDTNQPKSPVRPAPLPPITTKNTSSEINPSLNHFIVISSSTLSGSTGS